ncbi:MAG TPA: hypothetical protein VH724_12705 [Candidatus Angelobacter sp.]|jgi:hypothetical protein|nr:hypothetical protein [Candidatus Angelobacter sp.]
MDPVKVVIFVAAFIALLFLGRWLSTFSESATMPSFPGQVPPGTGSDKLSDRQTAAVVGADLPFPIYVPAIERNSDGRYNRPEFLNYYFEATDLVQGPLDPAIFYDDFYLLVRDIENDHTALYKYFVATPLGLQKALADEHLPAICLEEQSLIVSRWDVPLILETVVKKVMQSYAEQGEDKERHALPNPDVPEK